MLKVIIYSLVAVLMVNVASADIGNWQIVNNTVFVDDSNVYIGVTPHTMKSSGDFELVFNSKEYSGGIDVLFGFDKEDAMPSKALYYNPRTVVEEKSYICSYKFNYSLNPNYARCYITLNSTSNDTGMLEFYNETVFEHSFTRGNVSSKTIWWNESVFYEWTDVSEKFNHMKYDYMGNTDWYYIKNFTVQAQKEYLLKVGMNIKIGSSGKYWVAFKPSHESIGQAINNSHLYVLDPWWNVSYLYKMDINCSKTNNGVPIIINGSKGFSINGIKQYVWTNCKKNLSLYYNNNLSYVVVENEVTQVPHEVENGTAFSYNPTGVWGGCTMVVHFSNYSGIAVYGINSTTTTTRPCLLNAGPIISNSGGRMIGNYYNNTGTSGGCEWNSTNWPYINVHNVSIFIFMWPTYRTNYITWMSLEGPIPDPRSMYSPQFGSTGTTWSGFRTEAGSDVGTYDNTAGIIGINGVEFVGVNYNYTGAGDVVHFSDTSDHFNGSTSKNWLIDGTRYFHIGCGDGTGAACGRDFYGAMDEFRICNAMSQADRQAIYYNFLGSIGYGELGIIQEQPVYILNVSSVLIISNSGVNNTYTDWNLSWTETVATSNFSFWDQPDTGKRALFAFSFDANTSTNVVNFGSVLTNATMISDGTNLYWANNSLTGGYYRFSAKDDVNTSGYIELNSNYNLSSFTVCLTFNATLDNVTNSSGIYALIGKSYYGGGQEKYSWGLNIGWDSVMPPTVGVFSTVVGGSTAQSVRESARITLNKVHDVCADYGNGDLYLDGAKTDDFNGGFPFMSNINITIGRYNDGSVGEWVGGYRGFNGTIDNVVIYNWSLSAEQIAERNRSIFQKTAQNLMNTETEGDSWTATVVVSNGTSYAVANATQGIGLLSLLDNVTIVSNSGANNTNTDWNVTWDQFDMFGNYTFWERGDTIYRVLLAYPFMNNYTAGTNIVNYGLWLTNGTEEGGTSNYWVNNIGVGSGTGYFQTSGSDYINTSITYDYIRPFSVCTLFKPTFNESGLTLNFGIGGKWDSGYSYRSWLIWYSVNATGYYIKGGSSDDGTNIDYTVTKIESMTNWYDTCFILNATGNFLYINGLLNQTNYGATGLIFNSSISTKIGAWTFSGDFSSGANATIADFIIYNWSLSGEQIAERYRANMGRTAQNLMRAETTEGDNWTVVVIATNYSSYLVENATQYVDYDLLTCTYAGTGNWSINCTHHCNITATNMLRFNFTITGGESSECCTYGLGNISNYTYGRIERCFVR